jgi:nicotinate-nucleotide adenylyltransferase
MRLGIFGGSFDPVHLGHLALATCCQRQATLDQVWFTPTAVQPLKQDGPGATHEDRVAMLQLALTRQPKWQLCQLELERGGVSFTVDTLRTISAQCPTAELYLLMGADTLRWLPSWKSPEAVCQLATPLVVHRAGEQAPDFSILAPWVTSQRAREIERQQIEMPAMQISSSQIRLQVAQGGSLEELVPAEVGQYIDARGLYRLGS